MLYIPFRVSSTERVDRRRLVDRLYPPLVPANSSDGRLCFRHIFGCIVTNHVQYPL